MKLGLINSAWVQVGRGTSFGIAKTRELGFDAIDIFADPLDIDIKERRLIPEECARAGLPIVRVACVALGLIDFNPSVQRFHAGRVGQYLNVAYEFQTRNGVVNFPPYLEAIKRLGIDDATISVELEYSPDPDYIVEWVAEAHDKTAALMRAAGLRT